MTELLTTIAVQTRRRSRRDVHENSILAFDDPRRISINDKAVPPSVNRPIPMMLVETRYSVSAFICGPLPRAVLSVALRPSQVK